jgi:pimeloyl-ACP methyl ester carboxylesterase
MMSDRIHRAVSVDGTEIAGRVHGQGPPLVLFHGAPHDGDLAWEALVPHLADRFTCYLPSWRGRGLSADREDHTPPRHEEDATAFVDSIGGSVDVAGWSAGVMTTLGAAANSDAVSAVAQTYAGPESTDPEAMARVSVPVLLLRGQQTRRATFYADTEQYVADHVPDPHVRGLPGVGHFAPTVAPEPVAEALISYFGSVRKPV